MSDELPACWRRPRSGVSNQGRLFIQTQDEFLVAAGVSRDDLRRWRRKGWLHSEVDSGQHFGEEVEREIEVVAKVARCGLSDAVVSAMLMRLPRPVAEPAWRLAYNFQYGWVTPAQDGAAEDEADARDVVEAYLQETAEAGDVASLIELRVLVERAIEDARKDESGDEAA